MQSLLNAREHLLIYVVVALLAILALTQLAPVIATLISEQVQRAAQPKFKPSL
jgi:hypothetical protein